MKNTKRFIRTLSSLLAALLLASGCAKNEQPEPTATPIAIPTPTPAPQPETGGTLILPIPRNPFRGEGGSSYSPLTVNTEEMRNMYSLVYEPLLRCDSNNRITPSLAEKWSSDDTGRVWTIQLRKNVMWHNGDMLTAEDVLYTIGQIRSLGGASYYGIAADAIESYEQADEGTVRITMKKAGMAALYALVFPVISSKTPNELNGTGPYQVQSSTETSVELTVNPRWWKQAPYITNIQCLSRENNDVALDSYEARLLNMVPTKTVSAGKYREEDVTSVLDVMTQEAEVLLVNHNNAILSNPDVRKAIAYALDRGALVSNVYMNRAAVCDVPVPPDSFLYDATTKIYDHDPEKAAQLLNGAGWTDEDADGILQQGGQKLRLTLLVNDSTESTYRKNAAALIATQLLKAGIEVEVVTAKLSIGQEDGEFEEKLKSGAFDLALAGFQVEPCGNLAPYLAADGARNYGKATGDWNTLLASAAAAADENGMRQAHAQLQQQFVQELPFIMLYFRMNSIVYSANIRNVSDIRGTDLFRTVGDWYMTQQPD
ncbi:MAG TPA: peptide ABC transporter substrate-binding protein [Feifaniaceae bacterium]|nr:peptide ABC transporter substrate-binding protein [Feifaniaceae bacterium]